MIEKRAESVGSAGTIVADALLRPAAVVDGVIRLDGGDDGELCEALEVFGRHMLRVLDAEAAVEGPMGFGHFRVQIKNDRDPLVADGMGAKLKTSSVGLHHPIAHERERLHFIGKQAVIIGLIGERLEEISRGGT